jgi:hypothetical protein
MRISADFPNLTETRASLDAIADGLSRALSEGIRQDAQPLLVATKALTPYGPGPRGGKDDLPHIRDTIDVSVSGGTIAIIASHPGAIVHEWGGTIKPRGVAIKFKEAAMARRAAVQQLPAIERNIDARIDRLL